MNRIVDELLYLNSTKEIIKDSINNKNISVEEKDTFRNYTDKIDDIKIPEITYKEISSNGEYDGRENTIYSPIYVKVSKYIDEICETSGLAEEDIKAGDIVYFDEEYDEWIEIDDDNHYIVPTSHGVISSNGQFIYTIGYIKQNNRYICNNILYKYNTETVPWAFENFYYFSELDKVSSSSERIYLINLLQDGDIGVLLTNYLNHYHIVVFNLLTALVIHDKFLDIDKNYLSIYLPDIKHVKVTNNFIYFSKGFWFNRKTEVFEKLPYSEYEIDRGASRISNYKRYDGDVFYFYDNKNYYQFYQYDNYPNGRRFSLWYVKPQKAYIIKRKRDKRLTTRAVVIDNCIYYDYFRYCYNPNTNSIDDLGEDRFPVQVSDELTNLLYSISFSKTKILILAINDQSDLFIYDFLDKSYIIIASTQKLAITSNNKCFAFSPKYIICQNKVFMNTGKGRIAKKISSTYYENVNNPYSNPKEKSYYEKKVEEKYLSIDEPSGNPSENKYYERKGKTYEISRDSEVNNEKKYYILEQIDKYFRTEDETIVEGKAYYRRVEDDKNNDRLHKTIGFAKTDIKAGEEGRFYLLFS